VALLHPSSRSLLYDDRTPLAWRLKIAIVVATTGC
jgi:hypothetical protein